jgi:hypothetical protein
MTEHEKIELKVACVKAAAILTRNEKKIDPHQCASVTKRLYDYMMKIDWETSGARVDVI